MKQETFRKLVSGAHNSMWCFGWASMPSRFFLPSDTSDIYGFIVKNYGQIRTIWLHSIPFECYVSPRNVIFALSFLVDSEQGAHFVIKFNSLDAMKKYYEFFQTLFRNVVLVEKYKDYDDRFVAVYLVSRFVMDISNEEDVVRTLPSLKKLAFFFKVKFIRLASYEFFRLLSVILLLEIIVFLICVVAGVSYVLF